MKSTTLRRSLCALGMAAAFMGQAGWALAGTSGGIAGIISDAKTGQPIPGVHLQISSAAEVVNTTTDAHGHYIVFALQPDDDYTLTAQKPGYYARAFSGYSVSADQTQRYDLELVPAPAAPGS